MKQLSQVPVCKYRLSPSHLNKARFIASVAGPSESISGITRCSLKTRVVSMSHANVAESHQTVPNNKKVDDLLNFILQDSSALVAYFYSACAMLTNQSYQKRKRSVVTKL